MGLLWRLDHVLQTRSKRMAAIMGVSGPQRLVLRMLGRFGSLSAGDVARLLSLDPSTLTGILRRLEDRQLIKRLPHAMDGRRVSLVLTQAGGRINRSHAGTVEEAVRRALRRVSKRDLAGAQTVLTSLIEILEPVQPSGQKHIQRLLNGGRPVARSTRGRAA
jgi:DNA-binding MarR family transcriptional regulator